MTRKPGQPTKAQLNILALAYFGAPMRIDYGRGSAGRRAYTINTCKRMFWLTDADRLTDAGLRALKRYSRELH